MDKMKLSSPWQTFFSQMKAMFGEDESIKIETKDTEDEKSITLYVTGQDKADALAELLPTQKNFGGVTVDIIVKPSNEKLTVAQLYDVAFAGNPAFSFAKTLEGLFSNPLHYVVFRNAVVQFWNDDIGDIYGNCTTLYQDIARDIFTGEHGELFCTDRPDNVAKGEKEDFCEEADESKELPWQ